MTIGNVIELNKDKRISCDSEDEKIQMIMEIQIFIILLIKIMMETLFINIQEKEINLSI